MKFGTANVSKALTKVFGSRNERLLKRYQRIVDQVNALEPKIQVMTDPELRQRTVELRADLKAGKVRPADVMPEAFGIIRESMDRHIGIRAVFDPDNQFDPDVLDDEMARSCHPARPLSGHSQTAPA
jgi:preprotein translocase subunit SecA